MTSTRKCDYRRLFQNQPVRQLVLRATGGVSGSVLRALTDQLNDLAVARQAIA